MAAIGAIHFSVRGFGRALFYILEVENEDTENFAFRSVGAFVDSNVGGVRNAKSPIKQ